MNDTEYRKRLAELNTMISNKKEELQWLQKELDVLATGKANQ